MSIPLSSSAPASISIDENDRTRSERARVDGQLLTATSSFTIYSIPYTYEATNGGSMIMTMPGWSNAHYRSTPTVNEHGETLNEWSPIVVTPLQLRKREMTGKPLRV